MVMQCLMERLMHDSALANSQESISPEHYFAEAPNVVPDPISRPEISHLHGPAEKPKAGKSQPPPP